MGGAVVRALASLQCGPDSFSSPEPLGLICNRPRNDENGPGLKSRRQSHAWVEFAVGSLPCPERFFTGYSGFPLSSKPTLPTFHLPREVFHRILRFSPLLKTNTSNLPLAPRGFSPDTPVFPSPQNQHFQPTDTFKRVHKNF